MNKTGKTISQIAFGNERIISSESTQRCIKTIKENNQLLESCKLHDFSMELSSQPNLMYNKKYECVNCGGEVGYREAKWYELGVKHARAMMSETEGT